MCAWQIKMSRIIVVCFFISFSCVSQDIITKTNGDDIPCKVIEISTTEVKYKRFDNPEGPTFVLTKSEILMIRYQNGTKDIFLPPAQPQNTEQTIQKNTDRYVGQQPTAHSELSNQGKLDAMRYYTNYHLAANGALLSGIFCGVCALPVPIAASITTPQDHNLQYQNAELINQPIYKTAYANTAKKIKQTKVWTNYAIGCSAHMLILTLIYFGTP